VTAVSGVEVLVAVAIVIGLLGVIVPVLPGVALILLAILGWAVHLGEPTGWVVLGVCAAVLVAGGIAKYLLPGRRLAEAGIPSSTQWTGVALGVVGFFVVPVVGLFLGFVLGMYVAERRRVGPEAAWPSTRAALRAVGLSILIELGSAVLAAGVWVVGVVVT
jgi:uncharacterized protein YqgC (DUF456 family)